MSILWRAGGVSPRSLALGLGLALSVVALGSPLPPQHRWEQYLGSERNLHSPEKGLLLTWPEKGPKVVWEREAGEGYSGPVVFGNRLILFHRVGDEERTECLNPATGKTLWKHAEPSSYSDPLGKGDGPRSTPLLTADRVFTLSPGGLLLCLELESGKVVWKKNLADAYTLRPSFFGVGSSPVLDPPAMTGRPRNEGGRLLINVGDREAGIVALDKDTGKEVWKATDHDASYASPVIATLGGVRQAVFFTREGLVVLDPVSGKVQHTRRWRARIAASVNAASPVVVDDHIFLSACYDTGALLLRVGKDNLEEVWKNAESLSCHYTTPVHLNGTLYGIDGRQEQGARLRAVDWKTGKVLWTQAGVNCGSLLEVDGHLLVLSEDGLLRLVEATPTVYREKGKAKVLAGPCRGQIALAHGRLFARGSKRLVCLQVMKE